VAENALMRKVLEPERVTLGRLLNIGNYQGPFGGNSSGVAQGLAGAGLTMV
jgi:hypothetical protein